MSAAGPRVPPLPAAEWGDAEHAAVAALWGIPGDQLDRAGSGGPADPTKFKVLATMVHHPRLARGFFQYNRTILFGGKLNERQRELVILRVAHRQRSEYEWGQHVKLALDAGVTRSEIQAVATGNSAFNGVDLLMLQATDELLVGGRIEPTTWDRLAADLSTKQLMELVFCVGGYMTLGMAFESFGLEPESDTEPLPPPLAN